jgi:glycolate oxidase iron-sulfur subunit
MTDTRPAPTEQPSPVANNPAGIQYERFLDCVHCGLCTAACPTYLETGNENDSPRGRIYLMRAVTDGRIDLTPSVSRHLDLCLDCRSCESACPSGVQYGRLIEPFRVAMKQGKISGHAPEKPGWFERWILHGLFPYPRRLAWALGAARVAQTLKLDRAVEAIGLTKLLPDRLARMHRLLPRLQPRGAELPEFLPAEGERRAKVALFTGCVGDAMFHHINRATARVLQKNGCDVLIPRTQGCCGAIHYHSGSARPALEAALTNVDAFDIDDLDAIIVNVAGCGSMLKDYGHLAEELQSGPPTGEESPEVAELRRSARELPLMQLAPFARKVKDIHEFLVDLGPVPPSGRIELKATYHDACHLCHAQQIRTQPRQLLETIPGLSLVPLPESEICCGAAGSYNLTEGEMADRLGSRKLHHILSTGADAVVTGNAGCSLQIQAMLRQQRREDIAVLHPVELLDRSYG